MCQVPSKIKGDVEGRRKMKDFLDVKKGSLEIDETNARSRVKEDEVKLLTEESQIMMANLGHIGPAHKSFL
jgi:hypothetical protein